MNERRWQDHPEAGRIKAYFNPTEHSTAWIARVHAKYRGTDETPSFGETGHALDAFNLRMLRLADALHIIDDPISRHRHAIDAMRKFRQSHLGH